MGNKDGWEKGERELAGYSGVRMEGGMQTEYEPVLGKTERERAGKGQT